MQENYLISILQDGLERQLKEKLTEDIVKKNVTAYEKEVRESIKPLVESISIKAVERFQDLMRLRDEIHIAVHIKEVTEGAKER